MSARIFYQEDCNLAELEGKKIAIIGYGSQGHAHALNLKEFRMRCNHRSLRRKQVMGKSRSSRDLKVYTAAEAAKQADIIMILINDEKQAALYKE